jgi:pilus assembly protein CpaD
MTVNSHNSMLRSRRFLSLKVFVSLSAIALVSACSDPWAEYQYREEDHDYRSRHAVTVESTVARNWINFAEGQATISPAGRDKLERYFSDYIVAGHGHITVRVATSGLRLAVRNNRIAAVRQLAGESGLRWNELEIRQTSTIKTAKGKADLELGYIRYVAGLPNCPDWSKNVDDNSKNTTHSNFGCATQSNLGAMIVDPADLVRPRKARAADGATVDSSIRTVNVPRTHPKKGVGTVGAGSPVVPASTGTGSAPAPEGTTTTQASTSTTEAAE